MVCAKVVQTRLDTWFGRAEEKPKRTKVFRLPDGKEIEVEVDELGVPIPLFEIPGLYDAWMAEQIDI
jgi:hypothetical protein